MNPEFDCRAEWLPKLLGPVLEKRYSRNGLVILIDVYQTLDSNPNSARALFNDAQAPVGIVQPLLRILVGTPDTSSRLNGIEAAFWNRLDKHCIGFHDAAASRDALQIPLEGMGYCIKARTLDQAANAA